MQENELKKILIELYLIDPELEFHEAELIVLISRMNNVRPDTKFDAAFAARLKAELLKLNHSADYSPMAKENDNKIFNFNFMNKKIYIAAGSLAIISIAFVIFTKSPMINSVFDNRGRLTQTSSDGTGNINGQESISFLPAGAFGSLASVSGGSVASEESAKVLSAPVGMGGGIGVRTMMSASDSAVSSPTNLIAPIDAKMMPPFYGFKYVYKGEAINLSEEKAAVYRRLKGDGNMAKGLASTLSSLGISNLSLSTFSNLKMTNFSVIEDKDQGLMINFDFNEDNIYISENWEKWKYAERDNCGEDQACWERYRVKINDIPADKDLVTMADKFLADHKINLEHYGEALVDNSWREGYNSTEDKTNFYIPEQATVIYPLLIDGQAVRDQSGSYAGLRVTINIVKNAASGLNGLTPYRYEASEYGLETSSETIVKLAENGGWNRNYYYMQDIQAENLKTVELGTPEKAYVQIYKYENNRNEELLVPALIFPVINSADMVGYYGQRYIIVPLVKDILQELNNQPMPMYKTMMEGGESSSGSAGSAAETEPNVGTTEIMPVTTSQPSPRPALLTR